MKKVMIILIMLISVKVSAPPPPVELVIVSSEPINPYLNAWHATCTVESNYDRYAFNDKDPNGGSYGIVQIGQLKLDEYNKANGTNYQLQDCYNVAISRKIFMWHCMKYGTDIEIACKAWNGSGPMTDVYFNKIKTKLPPKQII